MQLIKEMDTKLHISENYFDFQESEEKEYVDIDLHKEIKEENSYVKLSEETFDTINEEQALLKATSLRENEDEDEDESIVVPRFSKLWKSNSGAFNDRRIKTEDIFRMDIPREKKHSKWIKEDSHIEDVLK